MARRNRREGKRQKRRLKVVPRGLKYNHMKFKMRVQVNLETDVNGDIQGQINSHSLTNFFRNNNTASYISLPEEVSVKNLFDQYRPIGIKIHFIPRYNQVPSATAEPAAMPSMAWVYDVDNSGTANYGAIISRHNCQIRGFDRPWKLYFRVPHASMSNSTNPGLTGGWNNLQNETVYTSGGVLFATEEGVKKADGTPFVGKLGALLLTYYCEFAERT